MSPISTLFSTRRAFLSGASAAALASAFVLFHPFAAQAEKSGAPAEVPIEDLLKPGDLPELSQGPAEAKVVVVEYASMTCGHCANFHNTVFPEFKKKYIDTGKVRFIMREFPLDNLAAAAAMLARCAGEGKTYPLIETLFATQRDWAFGKGDPVPRLFEIAKQAGFTQDSFDKCLTDQKLLDSVTATRTRAADVFGVGSTPTFFINGKRLTTSPELAEFAKVIDPLLAS